MNKNNIQNYISVTKEEFEAFIKNYPRKLIYDCYGVCEPPLITYNDFELGKWPDSIVAQTWLYDNNKNSIFYKLETEKKYLILENYKDYFSLKQHDKINNKKENKDHLIVKGIKDCSVYINDEKLSCSSFTLTCNIDFNNIKGGAGSPVII